MPAVAGLRTGAARAAALAAPPPDAGALRAIAAGTRAARGGGRWLAEHEAKALLRARGVPGRPRAGSPPTRTTPSPRWRELGGAGRAEALRAGAAPQDRATARSRSISRDRERASAPA